MQELFVDFSSAFNTIQPHVLIGRLLEQFKLSYNLLGWMFLWLSGRHCVSSAKGRGFNSQGTHILLKNCIA